MLRYIAFLSCCAVLNSAAWSDGTSAASTYTATQDERVWALSVSLNEQLYPVTTLIRTGSAWWAKQSDIVSWGIVGFPSSNTRRKQRGKDVFLSLADIENSQQIYDESLALLRLTVPSSMLAGSGNLSFYEARSAVLPGNIPRSGFLNYAFVVEGSPSERFALSSDVEVGVSTAIGHGLVRAVANTTNDKSHAAIYSSSFQKDWPGKTRTLVIGDSLSKANPWTSQLLFGGVHLYSNFGLRPGYRTYALPRYEGLALTPSTVTTLINQGTPIVTEVKPGPFALSDIAGGIGTNEVAFITRDALGRETVTRQTFYTFRDLLRPGLHDFSVELGAARQNVGIKSFDYSGGAHVVVDSRYGWNEKFTSEARLQLFDKTLAIGGGFSTIAPLNFGLSTSVAISRAKDRTGRLAIVSLQKQEPRWSMGATIRAQTGNFLFDEAAIAASSRTIQLSSYAAVSLKKYGDLSFLAALRKTINQPSSSNVAASWSKRWPSKIQVSANASLGRIGATTKAGFTLSLSIPIGAGVSASSFVSTDGSGQTNAGVSATRPIRGDTGYGWTTVATRRPSTEFSDGLSAAARLLHRGAFHESVAEISRESDGISWRAETTGAIGTVEGTYFLSRRIEDAFGLVKVDGSLREVDLQRGGIVVGRTDRRGIVVIPHIDAYAETHLGIDYRSLPLDVEATPAVATLVAPYRGAAVAYFSIETVTSALVSIVDSSGQALERGAEVRSLAAGKDDEPFLVGREGQVYLTRLKAQNTLIASDSRGQCTIELNIPDLQEIQNQTRRNGIAKLSATCHKVEK